MERGRPLFRQATWGQWCVMVLLSIGAGIMLVPFLWMVSTSLDGQAMTQVPFPPRLIPEEPTWKSYVIPFANVPLARNFLNSFLIALCEVSVSVLSALMAGYAFSLLRFRGAKGLFLFALGTLMIPPEVAMIPSFLLLNEWGMTNSLWAFLLPSLAAVIGTFLVKQYMDSLPTELRDAAKVDGASEWAIFWRIYVPLSGPVIATLVILQFLWSWNDVLWPLLMLSNPDLYTVQIGVAMFVHDSGQRILPAIHMAVAVLSLLPVLVLYLLLQRYVVQSIAYSGIKQ